MNEALAGSALRVIMQIVLFFFKLENKCLKRKTHKLVLFFCDEKQLSLKW